jgi:hypothetical protein
MNLTMLVRQMNNELACQSHMRIGSIVKHPKGYKVKIVSGCYLDAIYGRVSNCWTWKRVGPDGKLGKSVSGYGW